MNLQLGLLTTSVWDLYLGLGTSAVVFIFGTSVWSLECLVFEVSVFVFFYGFSLRTETYWDLRPQLGVETYLITYLL